MVEGTPKPTVPYSVAPASSAFASLPHALATHHPPSLPPQPWLCLGCTHANNNNVPFSHIHSSASLGPPARGTPHTGPQSRPSPPTLPPAPF